MFTTIFGDRELIQKKICILGSSNVGKTSLIKQFVEGIFNEKYLTTIGVKIDKKTVIYENKEVKLMVWDIEGTDAYNKFQIKYLRGCSGYIIVTDRTRSSSLTEGLDIHMQAREVVNCPAVLAINKFDLPASLKWGDYSPENYEHLFDSEFNTSAKTGENVEEMFSDLVRLMLKDVSK